MSQATGSQAIARALRDGGIGLAAAFPGSPATALATGLAEDPAFELRWSVNENTALSFAFGAAMGGQPAVAIMKHVGINVARDALEVMGVVHTLAAPLVLVEGADAKPGSSQSAQDNRPVYAGSANLLVLAPTSVRECYHYTRLAIQISRRYGMIVVVRGDARTFQSRGDIELEPPDAAASPFAAWPRRPWSLATSARTYAHHLERRQEVLRGLETTIESLSQPFGSGAGSTGVVVAGHLDRSVVEAAEARGLSGVRLATEHPLPVASLTAIGRDFDEIVVLEECLPHLENSVRALGHALGSRARVVGRSALGDARAVGRLDASAVERLLDVAVARSRVSSRPPASPSDEEPPAAAIESATLLAHYDAFESANKTSRFRNGDPRVALFERLAELGADGDRTVFVATDPGVTGLLALGDKRSDVKMHMGGAVPIAAGWSSTARDRGLAIAVVGDTNLPHSEWNGLVESASLGDELLVVIVDNGHSEMTQRIVTARPSVERSCASLRALGITVEEVELDLESDAWSRALDRAAAGSGVRLVWLRLEDDQEPR